MSGNLPITAELPNGWLRPSWYRPSLCDSDSVFGLPQRKACQAWVRIESG